MLDKKYNHKEVENGKYEMWLKSHCFDAGDKSKDAFTIVIPPPNVTGIQESVFGEMSDDLKTIVNSALKRAGGMAPKSTKSVKNEDKNIADAVIDPSTVDSIPGCFVKLVDPRMMVPIKIFDHIIGYYYFENYDYARMGTTVTDMLTNQINFNEQNMVIDNMVRAILGGLKYGDILNGDDNFKSMILNCILYAEKRQNPIKIKFVPFSNRKEKSCR